jgi:hypothetical protein
VIFAASCRILGSNVVVGDKKPAAGENTRVVASKLYWFVRILLKFARLVTLKPSKINRAALGDHIDHAPAGPADVGVIGAAGDLEFLNRVLAEAVRVAAGAGPARGLSEEHVIGIGAIYQQAVGGAALSAEREIAAARF